MKVQVAEELRQCTEEHDSMLHERLEHEDRLRKVCSQQHPTPSHMMVSEGIDALYCDVRSAEHHQVMYNLSHVWFMFTQMPTFLSIIHALHEAFDLCFLES